MSTHEEFKELEQQLLEKEDELFELLNKAGEKRKEMNEIFDKLKKNLASRKEADK